MAGNVRVGSVASFWSSADYFRSSSGNGHSQGGHHVSKVPRPEVITCRNMKPNRAGKAHAFEVDVPLAALDSRNRQQDRGAF